LRKVASRLHAYTAGRKIRPKEKSKKTLGGEKLHSPEGRRYKKPQVFQPTKVIKKRIKKG